MEWWQSFILGLVEGITEYLPISSTGHLLVVQRFLGIESSDEADAFAICIQAGAILAVLGLYKNRIGRMTAGLFGRDPEGLRLTWALVAAFLPAAIIGLLLNDWIKAYLFGGEKWGLWPTVAAWFIGGVAILVVDRWRRARAPRPDHEVGRKGLDLAHLTWRMALVIGGIQCLAMWPGVSRSLVTIVGGILVGLSLPAAVEFSFLLGVLTLSAATLYDGLKYGGAMVELFGWPVLFIGAFAAWFSAVLAVKWMVAYLNRHGLALFGWYRIAIALVVGGLIAAGVLDQLHPASHGAAGAKPVEAADGGAVSGRVTD